MKIVSILKVAYQVLAAIAVVIGIVVGYNQLRIWQTEGKSHMDELIRGVLIVVFVGCVIGSAILHFLAARMNRSISPKNRIRQQPAESKTLVIHRAYWGPTEQERNDITESVQQKIENGSLDVEVSYMVLGDPLEFRNRGKYLWITYSVPSTIIVAEQPTPARLILPLKDSESAGRPSLHSLRDTPLVVATRRTFESLSVSQRFLVKEIYEHPGTAVAFLGRTLSAMEFPPRVGMESLNRGLTTNLVHRTPVNAEPNSTVKTIVETLLESANLPPTEIVKQINSETIEAVKTDCKLGCDSLLEELKQEHSKKLKAVRADLMRPGACDLLIDEAKCLQQELRRIIDEDANDQFEKKLWPCPLDPAIINISKGTLWSWQHRAWSKWNSLFWSHCFAVKNFGPKDLDTDLTKATAVRDTVEKLNNDQMFKALETHHEMLAEAQKRYEDLVERIVSP